MTTIEVSIVAFYLGNNILLENRRYASRYGEEWRFYGGKARHGENKEQTLERSIKERLGCDLKYYDHLVTRSHQLEDGNTTIEHLFIAGFPGTIKITKGMNGEFFTTRQMRSLKLVPHQYEYIDALETYLTRG